jgi:hypothetical protein
VAVLGSGLRMCLPLCFLEAFGRGLTCLAAVRARGINRPLRSAAGGYRGGNAGLDSSLVRGHAASVIVALCVCGAALGAGWAIQIGVLPRAARTERVAASVAGWFLRHRVVESSFQIDGRRESGLCLHSWFARPDGVLARGALLVLGDGSRILDNGAGARITKPPKVKPWPSPIVLLDLGGCSGIVGNRLAADAVDETVTVTRAYAAGRPALVLHVPTEQKPLDGKPVPRVRLTIYVSARTYRPLALAASLGALRGVARILAIKANAAVLERFEATGPHKLDTKP